MIGTVVADICALAPGTERPAPRTLRFADDDFRTIYRCLLTWMKLGQTVSPAYPVD